MKVRLEFWVSKHTDRYRTAAKTLAVPVLRSLDKRVASARFYSALMQTVTLLEILVDKVLALACRDSRIHQVIPAMCGGVSGEAMH